MIKKIIGIIAAIVVVVIIIVFVFVTPESPAVEETITIEEIQEIVPDSSTVDSLEIIELDSAGL